MNCNCTKEIGCFQYNGIMDFGFINDCGSDQDFTFQIFQNGTFMEITETIANGANVELPYTFNENMEVMIKIKLPTCMQSAGAYYATSKDGACCFIAHGLPGVCIPKLCQDSGSGSGNILRCTETTIINPFLTQYNITGIVIDGIVYSSELLITDSIQLTEFIVSLGYECDNCNVTLTSIQIFNTNAIIGSIITSVGTFGSLPIECL